MNLKMAKSCCGCSSLRFGTKLIAILGIILCLGTVAFGAYGITYISQRRADPTTADFEGLQFWDVTFGLVIAGLVYATLNFILNIVLLIGAQRRNRTLVAIWFWINCVYVVLSLGAIVTVILTPNAITILMFILGISLNTYMLYIVKSFMNELAATNLPTLNPELLNMAQGGVWKSEMPMPTTTYRQ